MSTLLASYIAFWKNAFNFSGRTRRRDYWYATVANSLVAMLISFVLGFIAGVTGFEAIVYLAYVYSVAVIIPGLSLCIRRLHDLGKSGWWYLLCLTGIGSIVVLVWFCMEGQRGSNKYGEDPKAMMM